MNERMDQAEGWREYVLAEFRCALIKAKLAQLDIEAAGLALKFRIVTPEQAVAMFWGSEGVHFLQLELGQPRDAAASAESALNTRQA